MSGWIIALIIVAVLIGAGVVICTPWSPVYKAISKACMAKDTEPKNEHHG